MYRCYCYCYYYYNYYYYYDYCLFLFLFLLLLGFSRRGQETLNKFATGRRDINTKLTGKLDEREDASSEAQHGAHKKTGT